MTNLMTSLSGIGAIHSDPPSCDDKRGICLTATPPHIHHACLCSVSCVLCPVSSCFVGAQGKMSASSSNSAVYLTDSLPDIEKKITEHAFSGGKETKAEQEQFGADIEVDVSIMWLRFFLEDDAELAAIEKSYASGKGEYWSTGLVKKKLISVLHELVSEHQRLRGLVSDTVVAEWMQPRPLQF
mmetsp:Transcript_60639/g.131616  ORF Transcript_60639/g.131616 Transcript_60639/m.131616 type:complete len:184 (-) Transcript_60639:54-605(-)